jgi:adenosine deaminase
MKDYWLHMVMFNYCHTKFPDVKYSMHGELTLGLVQPEDLTSHINDAVYTAGANRIGHGVDMVESKSYELLRYMAKKQDSHRNQLQ